MRGIPFFIIAMLGVWSCGAGVAFAKEKESPDRNVSIGATTPKLAAGGHQTAKIPPPNPSLYKVMHVIAIGINNYAAPAIPDLNYAENDARKFAELMERFYGAADVVVLLGKDATKEGIITAVSRLLDESATEPDDAVVFYFAGHGQTVSLAQGGEMGYLIPQDAKINLKSTSEAGGYVQSCISMKDVADWRACMTARHVLFIADACYSGLMAARRGAKAPASIEAALLSKSGRILTAGGKEQPVQELSDVQHGAFTYELLRAMSGKADANKDGYIRASEIGIFVRENIPNPDKQNPQDVQFYGEGEMVFKPLATPDESWLISAPMNAGRSNPAPAGHNLSAAPGREFEKPFKTLAGLDNHVLSASFGPAASNYSQSIICGEADGTMRLWHWDAPDSAATIFREGHRNAVTSLGFFPANPTFVVSGDADGVLILWNTATGKVVRRWKGIGRVNRLAVLPVMRQGHISVLVASDDADLRIWDAETGSLRQTLKGHTDSVVNDVALAPDGKLAFSIGRDKRLLAWDVESGSHNPIAIPPFESMPVLIALSPEGDRAATAHRDNCICVWDVKTGALAGKTAPLSARPSALCFLQGDTHIVCGGMDGSLTSWNLMDGSARTKSKAHAGKVHTLALSQDGALLLSAGEDKIIHIWSVR